MSRSAAGPLRILHVIPSIAASTGGPAFSTVQLCRTMVAIGVSSTIFTTTLATPADAHVRTWSTSASLLPPKAEDVDIRFFDTQTPRSWCFSPEMGAALRKEVELFDVVHINSLNLYPQFAAARACRAAGVPYIVSPHGALDPFLRSRNRGRKLVTDLLWQREMLDNAAVVHAASNREAECIRAAGVRAPITTGPFGADLARFSEAGRSRPSLRANNAGIVILNHGRLHPQKGLDVVIRALPQVLARFPDARLELIGPDDTGHGTELDRLAQELGIANAVVRIGSLSGDELAERVAATDIWVLPSKGESFGIAVAEAMAAGVLTIVTGAVDLAVSAAAEADAAVIAEHNPDAFADAIIAMLANPDRAAAIAERGSAFVRRYDWSEVAPQFRDLYASVTGIA